MQGREGQIHADRRGNNVTPNTSVQTAHARHAVVCDLNGCDTLVIYVGEVDFGDERRGKPTRTCAPFEEPSLLGVFGIKMFVPADPRTRAWVAIQQVPDVVHVGVGINHKYDLQDRVRGCVKE